MVKIDKEFYKEYCDEWGRIQNLKIIEAVLMLAICFAVLA